MTSITTTAEVRPAMRGVLHLIVAVAAPFGLVWLLLIARSPAAYAGASIFAASMILLYGTSAMYHIAPWPRTPRRIIARIDHAMIFALIAGTYTPFCLLVLSGPWGITMLSLIWSVAAVGMLVRVCWTAAPRWLTVTLYLAVGWLAVVPAAELAGRMHLGGVAMTLAGGILYSLGALVYATRRPNPWPRLFGYHEVFHAFVIAGTTMHYAVIAAYVLPA
jgi:hemolysin III